MSSSVTIKALHSGWAVFSHTPGFFSTAADSWPVIGAALVWRALAMAERRVLSVQPGPTPAGAAETFRRAIPKTLLPWLMLRLFTLQAFRQLHRFHQLLRNVIRIKSTQLLLPK